MDRMRIHRLARTTIAFALYVLRRYSRDRASSVAASLSYTSLLSLVPLMAIALAMLAAFPVFGDMRSTIEDWVFANFVPTVGEALQGQVSSFIANAGRLSAAGIIGLGVSAIMLLVTIETALNLVFRVARPRSPLARLFVYWTLLTLGPLLIGASLSLQGYFTLFNTWAAGATGATTMGATLMAPVPTLLSIAAFTVLYALVPNRLVKPRDALAGGITAGLLFAVLRWGFALYVLRSGAYSTIYGAVAVVPIVLFWMFLSWAVVLVGAEITASLPEWRAGYAVAERRAPGERRLALALEVLAILHAAAARGNGAVARSALLAASGAPEAEVAGILRRLLAQSFIAVTTRHRYLLARDLGTVPLAGLVQALDLALGLDDAIAATATWRPQAEQAITAARNRAEEALALPLASLFARAMEDALAPGPTNQIGGE